MSHPPRIALFGPTGQVGFALRPLLMTWGDVFELDRSQADLSKPGAAKEMLERIRPQLVVNASAWTAVDKAESSIEETFQVNALSPEEMALYCQSSGAALVHFSTDYVYGAMDRGAALKESDPCFPINTYGKSKWEGEERIRATGAKALILRVSWLYDTRGQNFLRTMGKLFLERDEVRVVEDQWGAPTWAPLVASAAAHMAALALCNPTRFEEIAGVYNLSCRGEVNWHGFAEAIRGEMQSKGHPIKTHTCTPIPASAWATPALRQKWSVLDTSKLREELGIHLPHWRDALRAACTGWTPET